MSPKIAKGFHIYVVRVTEDSPELTVQDQSVLNRSEVRKLEFASEIHRAWLFQSNPQLYDLRSAMRTLREQVWSVSRYAKEIKLGDKVYLWEAGPYGGIIGQAEVSEPPCRRPEPWEQLPFIRAHALFLKERVRAKIRIAQIFDPPIRRQSIMERPEFSGLSVLRCSRGTNFRLSDEETEALENLISEMAA